MSNGEKTNDVKAIKTRKITSVAGHPTIYLPDNFRYLIGRRVRIIPKENGIFLKFEEKLDGLDEVKQQIMLLRGISDSLWSFVNRVRVRKPEPAKQKAQT